MSIFSNVFSAIFRFGKKKSNDEFDDDLLDEEFASESDGNGKSDVPDGRSPFDGDTVVIDDQEKRIVEHADVDRPTNREDAVDDVFVSQVNVVPCDWAISILMKTVRQKMTRCAASKAMIGAVLASIVVSLSVAGGIYSGMASKEMGHEIETVSSKVSGYEAVGKNLVVYKEYAEIPNDIPLYIQYSAVSFLCMKNGIYLQNMKFSDSITPDIINAAKESFAIETGKNINSVTVSGVWLVSGIVSPGTKSDTSDSNWIMDLNRQASSMFKVGSGHSTYIQNMNRGNVRDSVALAVIVWR